MRSMCEDMKLEEGDMELEEGELADEGELAGTAEEGSTDLKAKVEEGELEGPVQSTYEDMELE